MNGSVSESVAAPGVSGHDTTGTDEISATGKQPVRSVPENGAKPSPVEPPLGAGRVGAGQEIPDETSGVLDDVRNRTRRKRRRSAPPGWTVWVARQAGRSRSFVSHTLPIYLMDRREELVSYLVSLAVLCVVALMMALWVLPPTTTEDIFGLLVTRTETPDEELELVELDQVVQPDSVTELNANSSLKQMLSQMEDGDSSDDIDDIEDREFTLDLDPTDAEMEVIFKKGEFGGRSEGGKQAALRRYGGTAESEQAVNSGLKWLKGIQQKDGSWNFSKVGAGASAGGFRQTEVGATSLALLCFLGAGHTHTKEGPYQEAVEKGLAYIGSQVEVVQGTADLRGNYEGNAGMYVQGIAAICISEAHALDRRDKDLAKLTAMSIRFIEKAQNPFNGGWRYAPREDPGDTSVVGWQVMAMQSARAGRVRPDSKVLRNVREFLDSVQGDPDGSTYKYIPDRGGPTNSMSAVGLLCRMYLGWDKDFEPLKKGVHRLAAIGPSKTDMYYNYYASQVLHHWGDDLWKKWNLKMREQLVSTQVTKGPAAGSWAPTDSHGRRGGQIYQTALSVLTLEVYYRHLPMYQRLGTDQHDPSKVDSSGK